MPPKPPTAEQRQWLKDALGVTKADASPAPARIRTTDNAPDDKVVRELLIDPVISSMNPGTKYPFKAKRLYSDGKLGPELTPAEVRWESDKPNVVSIDEKGVAIAKLIQSDKVKITATDKEFGRSIFILVTTEPTTKKFGPIEYYATEESIALPLIKKAAGAYDSVKSMEKSLDQAYGKMNEFAARLSKFSRVWSDVANNTNEKTKNAANLVKLAGQDISQLNVILGICQSELEQAKADSEIDEKEIEKKGKQDKAAALRKIGDEMQKGFVFMLKTISNTISFATAIGKGPWGVTKAGLDELSELVKLIPNEYQTQAAALEKEAQALDLDIAVKRHQSAQTHLRNATKNAIEAQKLVKSVDETFGKFSQAAEDSYDASAPKDGFRFGDLAKGIGWATTTFDLAKQTYTLAYTSIQASEALGKFGFPPKGWNPPNVPAATKIIKTMRDDANRLLDLGVKRRDEATATKKKLDAMYDEAKKGMNDSKGKAPGK